MFMKFLGEVDLGTSDSFFVDFGGDLLSDPRILFFFTYLWYVT